MFKKFRKPWSSYWMGDALDRYRSAESESEKLMQLAHIRKGIANFVNILTGTDIPVKFSCGQQSYTDGQTVVVISAQNKPDQFDGQVGRALHEATHVIRSQRVFAWLRHLEKVPNRFLDDSLLDDALKIKRSGVMVQKDLQLVVNFLEDRRNDLWGYKQAPGYRPYYDAHYAQCFYSKVIDVALQHPLFRIPTMKVWEMHLLNMFSDKADPDALPGLRKVWEIIDLPHIDRYDVDPNWAPWEDAAKRDPIKGTCAAMAPPTGSLWYPDDMLPSMIVDAKNILRTIYRNAIYFDIAQADETTSIDENEFGASEMTFDNEDFSDMENYDMSDDDGEGAVTDEKDTDKGIPTGKTQREMTPEEIVKFKAQVKRALRRQKREVLGKTKKAELSPDEIEDLAHLESSDAEMREVLDENLGDVKCKVIIYKHVSEDTLKIPDIGFSSRNANGTLEPCPDSIRAIEDGKVLGNLLAHKIRIMNDEGIVRVTRQKQGRFDKRLVASIPCDNDNLFFKTHVDRIEPVMVDLSIDASGSMQYEKWRKAVTLSVALAVAAAKIRSFRIRINVRSSWGEIANVGVVYDSKKDNISKIDTIFKYLHPNGGTPEGLCYDAMQKELLEEIKQVRRFFVNLSDGEPSFSFGDKRGHYISYWGTRALHHTKRQVDKLRERGIRILSFFICDSWTDVKAMNAGHHTNFHTMYGKDAVYVSPKDVTEVAFVLNRLFLKE